MSHPLKRSYPSPGCPLFCLSRPLRNARGTKRVCRDPFHPTSG
ncbi:hypothetical protein ASZ90_016506 [hydrocarbon metagenome]|uniref:Uncharacterized protein n=1 Tax=hydrocarbon metagenome TaxID=938273 RepID=A0A0W8ERB6_9ZZZZ